MVAAAEAGERNFLRGFGEVGLRWARDRGDRETRRKLTTIFRNEDQRVIAFAVLEEKVVAELGEGLNFAELIKWIIENPEKFRVFLEMIISLFNPTPVPPAPA